MVNFTFIPHAQGKILQENLSGHGKKVVIDVSSYGASPYNLFSPFTHSPDFEIPVPGLPGVNSWSVEGIWQGLKLIDGQTDLSLLDTRPRKRVGVVEGHQFGDRILGYEEARWEIYLPAYNHYVEHCVPSEVIDSLFNLQREGKEILLFDVEDNGDIREPRPLAHASVLATYLNMKLFNQEDYENSFYANNLSIIIDDPTLDLEQKIGLLNPCLEDPQYRAAFDYRCRDHPTTFDDYLIGKRII
ncbi:hypothetical protein COV12_02670 [Candidatus Woesearchaeota archaeon CG10_big_fil_rev_8_21_14_0_10_32_24]|nr:MAG: hypothetical protein COV12_02670 [Candidatus Woesearchaeota archaeon CG10_big_fil_rev_8_21_14_0_10_32_24]